MRPFFLVPLVSVVLIGLAAAACDDLQSIRGSGVLETEERDIGPFEELRVQGGLPVEITVDPAAEPSMTVTIDDNLIDLVEQELDGGVLTVRAADPFRQAGRASIELTTAGLQAVSGSGGSDVIVSGIDAEKFSAAASGGAEIEASGRAERLEAEASGGGELHFGDLTATEAHAVASGGGEVTLSVSRTIVARASGGGDIEIFGDPAERDVETSGGGEIQFP